jgi:hypothetical protein
MSQQANFRRPNAATRFVLAVASFTVSASVLGAVCGAFEMQNNAAILARANAPAVVAAATVVAPEVVRVAAR